MVPRHTWKLRVPSLPSVAHMDTVTLFHPCRRPSGIPGEDYDTAAGAEARTALVPHFEEKYLQVIIPIFSWY